MVREATAIMQLMANNVDEAKRSWFCDPRAHYSLILKYPYREPVATRPPKVALIS
jgi:hypothetical protein